jgi:hypothetical protein
VIEYDIPEIRVALKPVPQATKGTPCSVPIDFSKVIPGAGEMAEIASAASDQANKASKGIPIAILEGKLRRGDKVYLWE